MRKFRSILSMESQPLVRRTSIYKDPTVRQISRSSKIKQYRNVFLIAMIVVLMFLLIQMFPFDPTAMPKFKSWKNKINYRLTIEGSWFGNTRPYSLTADHLFHDEPPANSTMIDSKNAAISNNKWIVITSINHPTGDVKRLAQTGWNLVVVGDKKTPKDWNLTGVHYLSVEKQTELGLKLPSLLPFGTYTRKNVGYLYAIMKGAKWIYDTDDDNKPYGLGLDQFDYGETISGIRFQEMKDSSLKFNVFNPYSYFGNAKMWPRGFPLEMLSNHSNGVDRMVSCRKMKVSAVQQGLVHKDPDVDAIYRLMHADEKTGLNEKFDKFAPPITLEDGTYSPWNSQNTLFSRKAFFTMFLPTTVEFRVTDIWRSFFSQKLLHLIGETVAFYPVNAIQIRNAHNYLADFKDESAVYLKSGEIIRTLSEWKCSADSTEDCTLELAQLFSDLGFWKDADVALIREWITDLKTIGYEFPPLIKQAEQYIASEGRNANCIRVQLDFSRSHQSKLFEQKQHNMEELADFCDSKGNVDLNISRVEEIIEKQESNVALIQKQNTALIITANWPWTSGIGVLQRLYEPYFAVTIFCGTWDQDMYDSNEPFPSTRTPFNYVHLSQEQMVGGIYMYYCLSKARDLKLQNIQGYYMVSDDSVLNIWHEVAQDQVVYPLGWEASNDFFWKKPIGKAAAINLVKDLVQKKYAHNTRIQSIWKQYDELSWKRMNQSGEATMTNFTDRAFVDVFYVPTLHIDFFADMFELLFEAGVFLEVAVAKVLHVFEVKEFRNRTSYLWNKQDRGNYDQFYNSTTFALHAVKFGDVSKNSLTIAQYCNSVFRTFVDALV